MIYTIQKGDTLSGLAKRYNTTVNALVILNGISDPDKIYAGETLLIPDPVVSTVWNAIKRIFRG